MSSSTRRPLLRRVLLALLALVAVGITAVVLYNSADEIISAADTLTDLRWGWVGLAVGVEIVSYLVRGAAQALVLRQGVRSQHGGAPGAAPHTPGAVVHGAGILAGDAAAYCLPFGFAAAGLVLFRVLRRRHVDPTASAWMVTVSTVLYVGSVAALTIVAVEVAGDADPIPGLQGASLALLGGLAVLGAGFAIIRRVRPRRTRTGRPAEGGRVRRWLRTQRDELRVLRLPATAGAAAFGIMTVSWLCDISVLGIAYAALGAVPPWTGLLLAYCAGQVAAALPVTPGGIGVVEGSLTLALVAFGGAQNITLAAVLLYRMIAYWGCIPLGGLAWLALRYSSTLRPTQPTVPATLDESESALPGGAR